MMNKKSEIINKKCTLSYFHHVLSSIINQQNKLSASSARLCEIQAVETVKCDVESAPALY